MRFPSIKLVAQELRAGNRDVDDECDVRLQVYENGRWAVRWGDSSYDLDHSGFWGSGSVPGGKRRFNSTRLAEELIDQAREQYALEESAATEEGSKS